jgi:LacI family transcriptional regulator
MGANDRLAIGAMRYLHTHDIKTPEDMSVMGVDDIPAAAFTTPGLTTIRHDLYQLGTQSFDRLLALFKGESASCHEVLPVKFMLRESTGPRSETR